MLNEQPDSGPAPALEDESSARDQELKDDEVDSSQYEAIVLEYGEAMRELHSRVDGLAQQLQDGVAESNGLVSSSDGDGRPNPNMDKVMARIEEVERWLQGTSNGQDSKGLDGRHESGNLGEIQSRIGMLESRLEDAPSDDGRAAKHPHAGANTPMDLLDRIAALEGRLAEGVAGRDGHAGPVHETSEYSVFQTRIDALERWSLLGRIEELEGKMHGPSAESASDKANSSSSAAARGQTRVLDRSN